jgi:hypothetical protein
MTVGFFLQRKYLRLLLLSTLEGPIDLPNIRGKPDSHPCFQVCLGNFPYSKYAFCKIFRRRFLKILTQSGFFFSLFVKFICFSWPNGPFHIKSLKHLNFVDLLRGEWSSRISKTIVWDSWYHPSSVPTGDSPVSVFVDFCQT